jgi:hypothetical protein
MYIQQVNDHDIPEQRTIIAHIAKIVFQVASDSFLRTKGFLLLVYSVVVPHGKE